MKICKTFILILLLIAANSLHAGDEETNKTAKEILKLLGLIAREALSKKRIRKFTHTFSRKDTVAVVPPVTTASSGLFSEDFSDGVLPADGATWIMSATADLGIDDPGGRGDTNDHRLQWLRYFDSGNYGNNGNRKMPTWSPPLDFSDAVAVKLSFERHKGSFECVSPRWASATTTAQHGSPLPTGKMSMPKMAKRDVWYLLIRRAVIPGACPLGKWTGDWNILGCWRCAHQRRNIRWNVFWWQPACRMVYWWPCQDRRSVSFPRRRNLNRQRCKWVYHFDVILILIHPGRLWPDQPGNWLFRRLPIILSFEHLFPSVLGKGRT